MKYLFSIPVLLLSLLLVGCLDNTQEITVNENGSGLYKSSSDMSDLLGLARQMGAAQDLSSLGQTKMDTIMSLAGRADSLSGLSAEERAMVAKARLQVNMDIAADKMVTGISIPFDNLGQATAIQPLSGKLLADAAKRQIGDKLPTGGRQMPAPSSFDDFYDLQFTPGSLRRTLNRQRYAGAADDEFLKSMRELSGMGLSMKTTYIINLPKPATKAEGKAIKLSDDKKRVTIKVDIDDFFDEPEKLQYTIEY